MAMGQEVLVGVDVGTTSIKALAVTPEGRILSLASRETPWRHHGPLADADPRELASVVTAVCAEAATSAGPQTRVRSIGVTGIAEAGVLNGGIPGARPRSASSWAIWSAVMSGVSAFVSTSNACQ